MSEVENNVRDGQSSWLPLIAIAGSMVMMYITSFGVNVLISSIVVDLDTTVATLQLVIVAASLIARTTTEWADVSLSTTVPLRP